MNPIDQYNYSPKEHKCERCGLNVGHNKTPLCSSCKAAPHRASTWQMMTVQPTREVCTSCKRGLPAYAKEIGNDGAWTGATACRLCVSEHGLALKVSA